MSILDQYITNILVEEIEPLIEKYLPELRKIITEEVYRAMAKFYNDNWDLVTPLSDTPDVTPPEVHPISESQMVLFDLKIVPSEMNAAGIPGRDGIVLYALGQAANGYPLPLESGELSDMNSYYNEVYMWYLKKLSEAIEAMDKNPKLNITLIINDAVDRFGFRLIDPTYDMFNRFGNRVNPGIITPESAYGH